MRRLLPVLIVMVLLFVMSASTAFAASKTVKMTVYHDLVKKGNTVYCIGADCGICKVTLKKGKVKKVKWLQKSDWAMGAYSYNGSLKLKGKYLYYVAGSEGTVSTLCRINVKTGKNKALTETGYGYSICDSYVIKKNKLYVRLYDAEEDKYANKVMKLNGKSKKKTSVKAKNTYKTSNAKGYSVILKEKGSYVYTYLKTPKGKFKLGRCKLEEW